MKDRDLILNLLSRELAETRDDDRDGHFQIVTLITAAVALIGALGVLFYKSCASGYGCRADASLTAVPIWIYMAAPALPIALIAYAVLLGATQALRSYYARVIERRVHALTSQESADLPFPSWAHIQLEVTGQRRAAFWAQATWAVTYGIVYAAAVGCLFLAVSKIPPLRYKILALAVDGGILAVPICAIARFKGAWARVWEDAQKRLRSRLARTDADFPEGGAPDNERTLLGYLLLPRNQEEILKALFIPASFVLARLIVPGLPRRSASMMLDLWGFLFVFEFIAYQGRYLLNDVRDRREDCGEWPKRRFPCSWLRDPDRRGLALRAAFLSFVARGLLALLVVGCVLPYRHGRWAAHVAFLAAIFVISSAYESLRTKCKRITTKNGASTFWTYALTGVDGLGYGLRALVGFWIAGCGGKAELSLLAVGASLLGSGFVALTWALECTRMEYPAGVGPKGHFNVYRWYASRSASRSGNHFNICGRVLLARQDLGAPWSSFGILATVALAGLIYHSLRWHPATTPPNILAVAVLAAAFLAFVTPVRVSLPTAGVVLVGAIAALRLRSVPEASSIAAGVLLCLPLAISCTFRSLRYKDLPGFTDRVGKASLWCVHTAYSWFARQR